MPKNPLVSSPAQVKFISATSAVNITSPFLVGEPIYVDSLSGTTLYGANHPGDLSATKFARLRQSISGNKAFVIPSTLNTPANTTGGALSAANQLRVVVQVNAASPLIRTRGDQVAASGGVILAAGGGTAAADATLSIKGTTAANLLAGSVLMSVASSGANVKTILAGDKLNIAGDATNYYATATTATLNGTTEVNIAITPPLRAAVLAGAVVTVTAADGRTVIVDTAPAVNSDIGLSVLDAADVVTVGNAAGALTAGRLYDAICTTFMYTVGDVNVSKSMPH